MIEAEILTERLVLRHVTPQDCGRVTEIVNDPRIYRMLARVPAGQTKAATLGWILTHERGRETDTNHVFAIEEDGVLMGVIGAHRDTTDDPFEIGNWLAPEAWGKGYCTEAGTAMINWLLARGDGRALVSGHFADNPASGRVLAKLGFLPCGRDKMHCAGRGEKADHIMLARIA